MENRYQRQIQLSEIGTQGQENISKAKVLVVGAGGLGCPILQYLAAAGVGTLGIMDLDQVDLSNLHRQILFEEKDIGKNKAICAKSKLQKHNSEIKIIDYPFALNETNYQEIVTLYDIIVDGTDSLKSRYLINDACILLNKIMVYGALHKFEGQVSVFNYENGPSYRCLFPNTQSETEVPNCSEIGVLGVLPGVIGLLQATEVLKIITKKEDVLSGKMLCLNLLNNTQFLLRFSKKQRVFEKVISFKKPLPYNDALCSTEFQVSLNSLNKKEKIHWIDVRNKNEIPFINLPDVQKASLDQIESKSAFGNENEKKIFFCQSGKRSLQALSKIKKKSNYFSLKEGANELKEWMQNQK